MRSQQTGIEMADVTDAEELTKARQQRERFDRNAAWLQAHIAEVYAQHRGKYICIAGEDLFVAETVREAMALATAVHPDDDGWFTRYIPKEKMARIYAMYSHGYINAITSQVTPGAPLLIPGGKVEPPLGIEYFKLFAFRRIVPGLEQFGGAKLLDPTGPEVAALLDLINGESEWAETTQEIVTVKRP